MSIFVNESEFFLTLSKMVTKQVRASPEAAIKTFGLEDVIRRAIKDSLKELINNKIISVDSKVPPESLANLVDISLDEACPKINLWPLVSVLYPLANIKEVSGVSGSQLVDSSDGSTLDESINGGRYIDLS